MKRDQSSAAEEAFQDVAARFNQLVFIQRLIGDRQVQLRCIEDDPDSCQVIELELAQLQKEWDLRCNDFRIEIQRLSPALSLATPHPASTKTPDHNPAARSASSA